VTIAMAGRGALAASLLLAGCPAAAAPPTVASFVNDMLERYRRSYPDAKVEPAGELSAKIGLGGNEPVTMNFDRIFAFCQTASQKDCEGEMQNFVEATREVGADEETTPERLRLIVRGSDYLAEIGSALTASGQSAPIQKPLADGVGLLLMADFPRTTKTVNSEDLRKLGIPEDDAIGLGTRQVLARLPEVPGAHELKSGAFLSIEAEYAESLLLKSADWERLNRDTQGRMFVSVPGANLLLVGLEKDEDIAAAVAAISQAYAESPRPISPFAYRWRDGKWRAVPTDRELSPSAK
jgi:hypothetical protein